MGRPIASAEILVLGASYREDVGDTRYSGSELIVRRLAEMGAELRVHDLTCFTGGNLRSRMSIQRLLTVLRRFFRGQEKLKDLRVEQDLKRALAGADTVIFCCQA